MFNKHKSSIRFLIHRSRVGHTLGKGYYPFIRDLLKLGKDWVHCFMFVGNNYLYKVIGKNQVSVYACSTMYK